MVGEVDLLDSVVVAQDLQDVGREKGRKLRPQFDILQTQTEGRREGGRGEGGREERRDD